MAKVKIIKSPLAGVKTGDQVNYGLYTNQTVNIKSDSYRDSGIADQKDIRATYPEVDREKANVEVEKGETVISPDLSTIYKAQGKKHSQGGTPIKAEEGAYIVSDHIKVNPVVLESLGFKDKKIDKKTTWSKFLQSEIDPKQYNTYAAILKNAEEGKVVDPYMLKSAQLMMPELQKTVSKVTLGNELTKAMMGKPYTMPATAQLAMQSIQTPQPDEDDSAMHEMKDGGYLPKYGGGNPIFTKNNMPQGWGNEAGFKLPIFSNTYMNGDNSVDSVQHKRKDGTFGQGGYDMNRFKNTHIEYFIDHPNWSSSNPNDVKDFQSWYNTQNPNYFTGKRGFDAIDGQYGEYTHNAPGIYTKYNKPEVVTQYPGIQGPTFNLPTPKAPQTLIPSKNNNSSQPKKGNEIGFDWRNQYDLLTSMEADPTRYPWMAKADRYNINPQFDEANYYPTQAAQRQRGDLVNQSANPQMARANMAYLPDQISGILQETQRARGNNLNSLTEAQQFNAKVNNQYSTNEANRQTSLYDKTISSLDQRDIAKRLRGNDIAAQRDNLFKNRDQMRYYASQNPQYAPSNPNDYSSSLGFISGLGIGNQGNAGQSDQNQVDYIRNIIDNIPPEKLEAFTRLWSTMYGKNGESSNNYTQTSKKQGNQTVVTRRTGTNG